MLTRQRWALRHLRRVGDRSEGRCGEVHDGEKVAGAVANWRTDRSRPDFDLFAGQRVALSEFVRDPIHELARVAGAERTWLGPAGHQP